MKVAVLNDHESVARSIVDWKKLGDKAQIRIFPTQFSSEENMIEILYGFDVIIAMRERTAFPRSVLSKLPNLNLLVTSGMRNSVIDLEAAKLYNVTVCGTRSTSEPPVELTWGLITSLARNIPTEVANLRNPDMMPWQTTIGIGLHGKTLGIIGLGKTGVKVARVGKAFGMRVVAWSQNLTQDKADEEGVELALSKVDLLQQSDFITVHMVLSDRTKDLISFQEYPHVKPTAFLINTSRSHIVNEAALIEALVQNRIAGVGLDVFDEEPLPAHHLFRRLPNVIATPHLGYVTMENYKLFYEDAIVNVIAYNNNQPIRQLN